MRKIKKYNVSRKNIKVRKAFMTNIIGFKDFENIAKNNDNFESEANNITDPVTDNNTIGFK